MSYRSTQVETENKKSVLHGPVQAAIPVHRSVLDAQEPGPIALVLADTQETPAPVRDAAVIFWEAPNRPASGARRLKSPGEQS